MISNYEKKFKEVLSSLGIKTTRKKLKEIAKIMGYKSVEWPRSMIGYVNYRINRKFLKVSTELRKLINKYVKKS